MFIKDSTKNYFKIPSQMWIWSHQNTNTRWTVEKIVGRFYYDVLWLLRPIDLLNTTDKKNTLILFVKNSKQTETQERVLVLKIRSYGTC